MPEASTQTKPFMKKLVRVPRPAEVFEKRLPNLLDQFKSKPSPQFVQNQCWYNAVHNIIYFKNHRNLDLHWVVGAQVLWGNRKKGEFTAVGMRGKKYPDGRKEILPLDRVYTLEDLEDRFCNSHSWLEDKDGNVYDMIYPDDDKEVRAASSDPVSWRLKPGMIEGVPRDVLDQMGCELIPFSLPAQKVVLQAIIDENEGSSGLGEDGEEAIELLKAVALPSLTAAIESIKVR
jgi:hypothetical protein